MLFLHALLCSLFATSTLAIPVPLGENPESNQAPKNNPLVNGLWWSLAPHVSEHHPS